MKQLSPKRRAQLFNTARKIHPFLGNLVQNPMELTEEIINQELCQISLVKKQLEDNIEIYYSLIKDLKK